MFENVILGFQTIISPANIFFCFIGCFIGTLIGVLPGIGPAGSIALLLPFTFGLPPVTAIIMLAGIFYGSQYGGSTTSILVNIPGEASTVVTCLDGYQMARQGRAGRALGIAAMGSFIAGTFGVLLLMLMAPLFAKFALEFGPSEFFALVFFSLSMVAYMSSGSKVKSFAMVAVGMIIGSVGIDTISGVSRFTFGLTELEDGIGLISVCMGLFGVGEILINLEKPFKRSIYNVHIEGLLPDLNDWKACYKPIARGSILGFFMGILPGAGHVTSSFLSYSLEKRLSHHAENFGKGAIEGVAGPESANNAATGGAFIPLLIFGIPTTGTMALLLAALMIHNITPGPLLITQHPDVFWGVIISMYIGNVMLLFLNLPLIGIWVKLLDVPSGILFPVILVLCFIGAYAPQISLFDINLLIIFGIIGYIMRKMDFEIAPLVFAYILFPVLEESFWQSLIVSSGDIKIFLKRPITVIFLFLTFLMIISSVFSLLTKKRRETII